jgi:AcrR family transcriptional regulator
MTISRPKPNPRSKTRARLLDVCRDLFNERGPDSVTTAQIAAAAAMNEGNLYYHFQRKEQLLEALFDAFESAVQQTAGTPGEAPERIRDYLAGWFRTMWAWRFFYRDGAAIFRLAPNLRARLQTLSTEGQGLVDQALQQMCEAGFMSPLSPAERAMLITNAWIVSAYWIDYLRAGRGVTEITLDHIAWGTRQVMHIFLPYLTQAGRCLAGLEH